MCRRTQFERLSLTQSKIPNVNMRFVNVAQRLCVSIRLSVLLSRRIEPKETNREGKCDKEIICSEQKPQLNVMENEIATTKSMY